MFLEILRKPFYLAVTIHLILIDFSTVISENQLLESPDPSNLGYWGSQRISRGPSRDRPSQVHQFTHMLCSQARSCYYSLFLLTLRSPGIATSKIWQNFTAFLTNKKSRGSLGEIYIHFKKLKNLWTAKPPELVCKIPNVSLFIFHYICFLFPLILTNGFNLMRFTI